MITPPPVVVQKKRGLGCFGCGCAVLLVILLLAGALIGGLSYFGVTKMKGLTSTSPTTPPVFDGGDEMYRGAMAKTTDFYRALRLNQPATLELSADELNTLIARDPNFSSNQIHAFIAMTGDHGDVQVSLPTNLIPFGLIKDRYVNLETDFTPAFDVSSKQLDLTLYTLKIGAEAVPKDQLPTLQSQINPALNQQLQRSPDAKFILDHAQSIAIRDGKLVIQAQ